MHRVESFFYFDFLEISPTTVIECFAIQPSTFSYCMYSYVSRSWTQATDRTLYKSWGYSLIIQFIYYFICLYHIPLSLL